MTDKHNGGFMLTPYGTIYAAPSPEEKEVISAIESVDLDIRYSPVLELPLPEGFLHKFHLPVPIEARQTGKGYIIIRDPQNPAESAQEVTTEQLRHMRARYLVARGLIDRNFRRLGHTAKCEAVANYFDGSYREMPWK